MGLLSDYQAISAQSVQLATDQAAVVAAQNAVTAAQAVVANDIQGDAAADAVIVADLTAAPYNGTAYVPDPNPPAPGGILVIALNAAPPGFIITQVPAAT
jgi:hypothetical protein